MPAVVTMTFATDKMLAKNEKKMSAGMYRVATEYANLVKRMMRDSPATGRVYKRGAKTHRASAPGEPPAPDTGQLLRSVEWRVGRDGRWWVASVFSRLQKSRYLEFGAARGVKHARGRNAGRIRAVQWVLFPRPAWGPALSIIRPRAAGLIKGRD